MSKIRINELARQLEVKSREVIDKLHELGITEALTHSSSIDDENAEKLRRYFGGDTSVIEAAKAPKPAAPPASTETKPKLAATEARSIEPPKRGVPIAPPMRPAAADAEAKTAAPAAPAAPGEPKKPEAPAEDKPRAIPLRPPMLGRGAPIHPPVGPRTPASAGTSSHAAVHPPAAAPLTPPPPLRPLAPPTRPIPSGGTRPGQILSGPRQPLPSASPAAPARPVPPPPAPPPQPGASAPVATAPPAPQNVRPGVPIAPPPRPAAVPGAPRPAPQAPARPAAGQPIGGQPLAGQPAARPVVPPRADLAARLGARPGPSAPGAPPPRPGVPLRPSSPRPGQPLYQGPPRPGQPAIQARGARPGMPGPGGRPGPRPMHPTSRGGALLGPGAPPPPDHAARRAPGGNKKPGGRGPRDRNREAEEKILRPQMRREQAAPPPINRDITISEGITVKELSEKLDVKANLVIKKLVDRGIFATINQTLDSKMATELAREFGASTSSVSYEEEAMLDIELAEEASDRFTRPPVVTIMGHVDHGKTSLLDAIRTANVAGREAGGITQHIGAYHVDHNGKTIVFIDTPGHEAFTRMRARGAKVTDIVVLVVAADDGVMPQTLEAIDHARAAKVPIIVAINKIDKPEAQPDRIKQQLADRGLNPEEWGGDTVMVPVSARQKTNLDLLLEMILLVSEIADLRANPARPGMASVLEAKLDRGRGPVATILVRNGTIRVGDEFICGTVFGRVRAMIGDRGEQVKEAGPSMPVEVLGLERLPEAGDNFQVVTDTAKAKQIVLYRAEKERAAMLAKTGRLTLDQLHRKMAEGEVHELPLILKADVSGSAEVLRDTLEKLSTDKVTVRVLRAGVGAINESDVLLAAASNAIVLGFNVRPERNAAAAAEQEKVDIELHTIIYEVVDQIKKAMSGLLAPVYKEVYRGKAEVREIFKVSKIGTVAGSIIQDGTFTRDANVRVLRDNVVVHTGKVGSLRRFKDDVSEVRSGMECGITLQGFNDLQPGDIIEAYALQRVAVEA
ncbi:MAG TPA: translation initiation factor IF-2 [Bryobacteraceae bacterium]|nr:translation initiation factor IF-2 [Bryobacteraceae bacterium]